MLNEWKEFLSYAAPPIYTAVSKRDTSYMGLFTMDMLLDFDGLVRMLTIME